MRRALLAILLLPLAGCLESPELAARLDETRAERDATSGALANMTAEARAWRDNASALGNASRHLQAERDDALGLLDASRQALDAREGELAEAQAAREATREALERTAALLAEAEKITTDDRTLQDLLGELAALRAELARADARVAAAQEAAHISITSIDRANVTWQFTDLRGDTHQWRYAMEDYRQDVKRARPGTSLYLPTVHGSVLRVADPRPYVDAAPFAGKVADIANGRSEQDFVREAFHLKRQLVDYQFAKLDEKGYYKYPGETLVEGTGICGDTTILLASLLEAGKREAGYGYETALWIVQWDAALDRFVKDPARVNHALLEVRFADGTVWYVETTSYELVLHPKVEGWRYPL